MQSMIARVMIRAAFAVGLLSAAARADNGTVIAKATSMVTRLTAYAQVEPISILRIPAPLTGIVTGLDAVPGSTVSAGVVLARLQGPAVAAVLTDREGAVASAQAQVSTMRKTLAIERHKLAAHLATQDVVYRAVSALAGAQAKLATARDRLRAARAETTLRSAKSGQVLTINAADGERVAAGQVVLTVQPADSLWLMAAFFGADAASIRPGMRGRFQPAGGGAAMPVTVRSILGQLRPDGGLDVGLSPLAASPEWRNGETGTLTLDGGTQKLAAVPSRALILDQGRWWVMVRTIHGDRRQSVVPGPSRSDLTFIRRGLAPGAKIVVENAYLDFHRDVSKTFQQPD